MPLSTPWPMVLALAITLAAAGYVTDWVLSILGGALFLCGITGWMWQLFPEHGEAELAWRPVGQRAKPVSEAKLRVESKPGRLIRRMQIPEKVHPYSAGLRGGLVGGAAMSVVAAAYGIVSGRGIWYPVNLLAAMLMTRFGDASGAQLEAFDATALVVGSVIHLIISAGAGLFYGILLPTLPRWPVLWGGIVAPILWTGASYGFMGVLNPVMNARVDWPWFVASQFVFGLVAGLVVVRSELVPADSREVLLDGAGKNARDAKKK
jgi:hypothetical protein